MVTIISPNGGEIFENEIAIEWSASDPDEDSLTYAIAYNDGGIGWHLIADNLTENSYIWNISNGLYSDSILLKVIAYDGYGGMSEDMSDFLFTIEPYELIESLYFEIIDQVFTEDEFNITIFLSNATKDGIDYALIQLLWNNTDISSIIKNLGDGIYMLSLNPIFVEPNEDPILLEFFIQADGFEDLEFSIKIAIDPDTVIKKGITHAGEFPFIPVIIGLSIGAAGAGIVVFVLLKRRTGK